MSDSGNRRDIELRIRAQDLSTADFQRVSAAVKELAAAVGQETEAAKKGAIGVAELRDQIAKLEQAGKALTSIQTSIDRFKNLSTVVAENAAAVEKARTTLATYRAQLEQSNDTSKKAQTELNKYVRDLTQAEQKLALNKTALEGVNAALTKSAVDTANLVQVEHELKTAADQVGVSLTALNQAQGNYARNAREAKEAAAALRAEQQAAAKAATDEAQAVARAQVARREEAAQLRTNLSAVMAFNRERTTSVTAFNAETRALADRRRYQDTSARDAVQGLRRDLQPTTTPAGGAAGLFGLRPYELQNLSYQINDIVSGIASGQRATQILAQQGGQVLQLFSRNLFEMARYLPQVAVGLAATTVAVGALVSAFRDVDAIRQFNNIIKSSADGSKYSATQLNQLQHELRALGISWADANTVIRQSIDTGLNQNRIKEFAQAARDIADIRTDKSVTVAFKELTEGFSKGVEGIRKFNDEYGKLTADELQRIQTLYTEGRGQEALAMAIDLTFRRLREGGKELSPFAAASRSITKAWDELTLSLSKTGAMQAGAASINFMLGGLKNMVDTIGALIVLVEALNKKYQELPSGVRGAISFARDPAGFLLRGAKSAYDNLTSGPADAGTTVDIPPAGRFANPRGLKIDTESLRQLAQIIDDASKNLPEGYRVEATSTERPGALVKGTNRPSEHGFGRAIDVRIVDAAGNPVPGSMGTGGPLYDTLDKAVETAAAKIGQAVAIGSRFSKPDAGHYSIGGREAEAFSAIQANLDAGQRTVKLAERELQLQFNINAAKERQAFIDKARDDAQKQIAGSDIETVKLQEQLVEIATKKFDAERYQQRTDFERNLANLRISDGKNAEAIATAGQQGRAKAIEDAKGLLTLEQANRAELQAQEEARKRFAQDEKRQNEDRALANQLSQLARQNELKDTTNLENRLKAVADQYATIRRALAKRNEDFPGISSPTTAAQIDEQERQAKQQAEAQFRLERLNSLQQQRNDLVAAENAAYAAGAITVSERDEKIRDAFMRTGSEIQKATEDFQNFLKTADAIDPTKIDLFTAKIKQFSAEAKYVDPLFRGIKAAIETSFTTGLSTAFETATSAIGGLIAGTQRWKDVLISTRNAALTFFADLLKAIARAIVEYQGLQLASALGLTGGSSGATGGLGSLLGSSGSLFSTGGLFGSQGALFGTAADASIAAGGAPLALPLFLHEGGIVGNGGPRRPLPVSWFANAPRYHSGTIVGLAPDEQAAILRKGEEVLSRDSPRNIMNNARRNMPQDINIRSVLVQSEDQIPGAMAGSHGERVVMSHLVRNAATLRQLVKG